MASIVVVGGGVAGLACAWRLARAGHDVEVLEREGVAGGRMRTETEDGFAVERGAQFVAAGYHNLLAAARTLGVADRWQRHATATEAVLHAGALAPVDFASPAALLRSPLVGWRDAPGLLRGAAFALRHTRRLEPLHPESAAHLDTTDLRSGLRRRFGAGLFDRLLEPLWSATFDEDTENLSLAFGLLSLRFAAAGLELGSFRGGNGLLTASLAAAVPVLTGCEVLAVETGTGGARVRLRRLGRESHVVADAAVVAVPGSRVAGLCPKLTPEERGFFEKVEYTRGLVAHLLLDEAPALPFTGVAFPRSAGIDLYGLACDHVKPGAAPPGAGLLNAALRPGARDRLWRADDAEIAAWLRAELARTPIGALSPGAVRVHRWEDLLPRFAPGHLRRLAAFGRRLDRSPRLAFAGDYLLGPTAEAALTSGMRAANEIIRGL